MFKLNRFQLMFDDSDSSGSGGPTSNDKDDIIKFLAEDTPEDKLDLNEPKVKKEEKKTETEDDEEVVDDKKTIKKEIKDETEDEDENENEEDDELEALLDETEEPDEEKLELVTPIRRREILKKYPTLFKDFPYLEKAYYREQQYTELLPTINDAKEAVEKGKAFDNFERDLMSGNVETLFKTIKEANPNSFYKTIDELMPTLSRVDPQAYTHILSNTIKHTIISMLQEAQNSKNETLESAAVILNQFVFGGTKFTPPSKLAKDEKPNEKEDELKNREKAFVKQQFDTASSDLSGRVNNAIKNAIEGNIDPKNSMSDYVKRNAVREANETLSSLIEKDSRFRTIIDRLWDDAFKNSFSKESVDRIKSAYLSKAKTLLPSVIKKARIDALKGIGKRVREDNDTNKEDKSKSRSNRNSDNKDNKPPRGMSTLEFLNQD